VLEKRGRHSTCVTTHELNALNSRLRDAAADCMMLTVQVRGATPKAASDKGTNTASSRGENLLHADPALAVLCLFLGASAVCCLPTGSASAGCGRCSHVRVAVGSMKEDAKLCIWCA
jgi:hypothetical protein